MNSLVRMSPELLLLLTVRLGMGLLSWTWYVPDETWQSVEVAHRLVYGRGELTWEWEEGIRSYLHPLLCSVPLALLKITGLDTQYLVIVTPKLLQGLMTGICEYCLYCSVQQSSTRTGSWFLLLSAFNWHTLYTGSRTLINTLEYSLTSLALAFYMRLKHGTSEGREKGYIYLPLVGLCFMVRPTSALLWAPLVLIHLVNDFRERKLLSMTAWLAVAVWTVMVCIAVDSALYGTLTIVPLNFFLINVYKNLGVNYGSHPWHWYFSNGLPCLLGPLLLLLLKGIKRAPLVLLLPVAVNLAVLSLLPHKEMRFLQSSLPFILIIASEQLAKFSITTQRISKALFLASNICLALYLSLVHQRGVVDAATWAGQIGLDKGEGTSVLFLMPCHSTPLHSHIHSHNVSVRYLHCEPNLSDAENYTEEADLFYSAPAAFLNTQLTDIPDIVLIFDNLQNRIEDFLEANYYRCNEFFHTHIPEGRVGSSVLAYCRN